MPVPQTRARRLRDGLRALAGRPWFPTALAGALATLLMGGQMLLDPAHVQLGSAETEAPGHLWGLWTVAAGIFKHGPFVRHAAVGWPGSYAAHLMDPINLVLFLPFYWLGGGGAVGASLGWNALHIGAVIIGAWGCWKLGSRVFGEHPEARWAIALLTLIFCASPYFLYVPYMGRTEYLPAVIYPGHLALLHRWLRRPVGILPNDRPKGKLKLLRPPPLWVGIAAGLTLGATALGGWYLAVFVPLMEIPIALWMSTGLTPKEAAARLGMVAGIATLCLVPAAWALLAYPPDQGSILGAGNLEIRIEQFPIDPLPALFRIAAEGQADRWMDQPGYVGVIAMVLAVVGALRFRANAKAWMLVAVGLLLVSAGPFLAWSTRQAQAQSGADLWPLPGYALLKLFPPLKAIRTWSRVGVLSPLPMGIAAAFGLISLTEWYPRWRRGLIGAILALVLADQMTYPNVYSPVRPTFVSAAPSGLVKALAKLPAGALLDLPIDVPLSMTPGPEARGIYMLWQLQHGRPVPSTAQNGFDTTLTFSYIARLAVNMETLSVVARGGSLDPAAPAKKAVSTTSRTEIVCAQADIPLLRRLGFSAIALHTDRAGASDLEPFLTSVLGPPSWRRLSEVVWDITAFPAAPTLDFQTGRCALPSLPGRVSQQVQTMTPVVWRAIQKREGLGS